MRRGCTCRNTADVLDHLDISTADRMSWKLTVVNTQFRVLKVLDAPKRDSRDWTGKST
jgi:hypothetical protein